MQKTTINSATSLQSHIGQLREAFDAHKYLRASYSTGKDRTSDQNNLMWSLLGQISKSVVWYGQKLLDTEWKDVLTASLKQQKVVPGINGGFVVCGTSTSKMNTQDFSEVCELAFAFGAQHGVEFRERVTA